MDDYQPLGVVGVISPWNFPVNLTFAPLAGVLSAGNRCMIKPSEYTPQTSAAMAEAIAAEFDQDEIAVVTGGPATGADFSGWRSFIVYWRDFCGETCHACSVGKSSAGNFGAGR